MKKKNPHLGSSFDEFLEEEGIRHEVEARAQKRVLAWQMAESMKRYAVSRSELARKMHTSRGQVNRLLDPENTSVTLTTIVRAATSLGQHVQFTLQDVSLTSESKPSRSERRRLA